VSETLIVTIRNEPRKKIDLVYDGDADGGEFILRYWNRETTHRDLEICLRPAEFIALLKAGLDYYEVNGNTLRKVGLQVVK
jgi:hypothetical protein